MANTENLKGIRCPECFSEEAFVVQITMNVVMHDDGIAFMGCRQPENDHFPGRAIPDDDGFGDDNPIQCFERRGGCGHWGTVKEFRVG
ncbi:hypothetical protein FE633_17360 [Streptomyces montanus]|uniref:Uncharacterized protein n=1 Tax=Streptomyces montanus TaxID=2580423 RepID=A0A5R9FZV1_9ACTN|nr:hypothetical protein [Streptomyces montanus]TLS44915.1 hypothetical protein FE633_17360 [Streptomyces montanus]